MIRNYTFAEITPVANTLTHFDLYDDYGNYEVSGIEEMTIEEFLNTTKVYQVRRRGGDTIGYIRVTKAPIATVKAVAECIYGDVTIKRIYTGVFKLD